MAEELPDLIPFPEDSSPSSSNLRRGAEWARDFGGNSTNLAQRRRHNQDTLEYTAALQQEQAARQAEALRTDKNAQNLYFKSKQLEMQQKNAASLLEDRATKMRFAEELHPLAIEAKKAQTAASLARQNAAALDMKLDGEVQKQEQDDTAGLQNHLLTAMAGGARLGTPAYAEALANASVMFPAANKDYFGKLWKTTNTDLTVEEVLARGKQIVAAGGSGSVSSTGNVNVSVKPPPVPAPPRPPDLGTKTVATKSADGNTTTTVRSPLTEVAAPSTPTPAKPSADDWLKKKLGK